ncbi:prepilin-type N-terminal cleavage/methylation domain-containing protein [Psychrosphaera sp. 1_MG-2023]|uniref:prepilin-type N-terminal cleavage/methylation domain-containing protein n=1 Tax=Psychrosphaera sp. 1_MG-2023 TaxID=3062643 RepID=UPI0026E491CC|nr:prepilin-type N-terminal cleavage/methylation domain-containing protein [Psychrosphaera sp. 1_MG-2023]MDO6720452.1 prepilin-type N-terminal cleavage/methylation domain-containing protein [Psychrosphaera sp. 1_MG-2023]
MHKSKGFTLLELLLVIVVIGYLVTMVRLPSLAPDPFELTEKQAARMTHLVNLASEYAVLNNMQLGLAVTEDRFAFLVFDGEAWQPFQEPPFDIKPLDEYVRLELILDGLSWQEDNLLSAVEFIDEERLEQLQELDPEEQKLAIPQIFILSSGEISPFDITVEFDDGFANPVSFLIRGEFTAPVRMYDPLQQLALDN